MPGRCTICDHEQRDEIEVIHIQGASTRDIAGQFAVTKSSVSRHMNAHLAPAVVNRSRTVDRQRAESLQGRLEELYGRAEAIFDQAEAAGRHSIGFAGKSPMTIRLTLHDGTPLRPLRTVEEDAHEPLRSGEPIGHPDQAP
jgi:hypothetical protein